MCFSFNEIIYSNEVDDVNDKIILKNLQIFMIGT